MQGHGKHPLNGRMAVDDDQKRRYYEWQQGSGNARNQRDGLGYPCAQNLISLDRESSSFVLYLRLFSTKAVAVGPGSCDASVTV